jgi:hypothetical protein
MTYSNTTAPTPWAVRATGNMTLSVVAATGEQIVRLDLLVSGAMRAGDNGWALARAWNNLALLASIPAWVDRDAPGAIVPHLEVGCSPLPWRVDYDAVRHRVIVRDADGRKVAERTFPPQMVGSREGEIVELLTRGVEVMNRQAGSTGEARCGAQKARGSSARDGGAPGDRDAEAQV